MPSIFSRANKEGFKKFFDRKRSADVPERIEGEFRVSMSKQGVLQLPHNLEINRSGNIRVIDGPGEGLTLTPEVLSVMPKDASEFDSARIERVINDGREVLKLSLNPGNCLEKARKFRSVSKQRKVIVRPILEEGEITKIELYPDSLGKF